MVLSSASMSQIEAIQARTIPSCLNVGPIDPVSCRRMAQLWEEELQLQRMADPSGDPHADAARIGNADRRLDSSGQPCKVDYPKEDSRMRRGC